MAIVGVGGSEARGEFDHSDHAVLAGTTPEPDGEDRLRDGRVVDAGLPGRRARRTGGSVVGG